MEQPEIIQIRQQIGAGRAITTDGRLVNVNTPNATTYLLEGAQAVAPVRDAAWHPSSAQLAKTGSARAVARWSPTPPPPWQWVVNSSITVPLNYVGEYAIGEFNGELWVLGERCFWRAWPLVETANEPFKAHQYYVPSDVLMELPWPEGETPVKITGSIVENDNRPEGVTTFEEIGIMQMLSQNNAMVHDGKLWFPGTFASSYSGYACRLHWQNGFALTLLPGNIDISFTSGDNNIGVATQLLYNNDIWGVTGHPLVCRWDDTQGTDQYYGDFYDIDPHVLVSACHHKHWIFLVRQKNPTGGDLCARYDMETGEPGPVNIDPCPIIVDGAPLAWNLLPRCFYSDGTDVYLLAVEYETDVGFTDYNIYRSTDDGATWSLVLSSAIPTIPATGSSWWFSSLFLPRSVWAQIEYHPQSEHWIVMCGSQIDAYSQDWGETVGMTQYLPVGENAQRPSIRSLYVTEHGRIFTLHYDEETLSTELLEYVRG